MGCKQRPEILAQKELLTEDSSFQVMWGPSPRNVSCLALCYCWECESRTQLTRPGSYRVRKRENKKKRLHKSKNHEIRESVMIFLWNTQGKKKFRAVWSSLNRIEGIIVNFQQHKVRLVMRDQLGCIEKSCIMEK